MLQDEAVSAAAHARTSTHSVKPSPLEEEVVGLFDQLQEQLERALEIYNESSGGRAMCDELQQIADQDMPRETTKTLNFGEQQPAGQPVGQRKAHL
jgi:hypothetical protein